MKKGLNNVKVINLLLINFNQEINSCKMSSLVYFIRFPNL